MGRRMQHKHYDGGVHPGSITEFSLADPGGDRRPIFANAGTGTTGGLRLPVNPVTKEGKTMLKFLKSTLVALTLLSAPPLAAQPAHHLAPVQPVHPLAALQTFTIEDLQAALADAKALKPPDDRHAQCWQALIDFLQNVKLVNAVLPKSPGAAQALQKWFNTQGGTKSLLPDSVVQACALTMSDLRVDAAKLAVMLGVGVASPIHLPIPIPGLP
jgi:hypothetical protein